MDVAGDGRLWRVARKLGRQRRHGKALPVVWFVTDPDRTPNPVSIAERLPRGAGIIFRHFGRPETLGLAKTLATLSRERGLLLLVGADPDLAMGIGAAGVHLPERLANEALGLKREHPDWIVTVAAHSSAAVRTGLRAGADAVLVSAIFASRSPSAGAPLGRRALGRIVRRARRPVYALGGVTGDTAHRLVGVGVAGFAAVEAFVDEHIS